MRSILVAALVACADRGLKSQVRGFLQGLSCDELQYIAGFLGACILESSQMSRYSRAELIGRVAEFQRSGRACAAHAADRDHKMILLFEYLCRTAPREFPITVSAGEA